MCLKFIKGKAKKAIAFTLALLLAGMTVAPAAYAETTKGYYGQEVKITHESKSRYVANATFYDYYSDSQVGTSGKPQAITDALKSAKTVGAENTFQKFNNKLLEVMKYGDSAQSPAKYPLYQGYFTALMTAKQTGDIFSVVSDEVNTASNFWLGANGGQGKDAATQGLVDSKLKYDNNGESYITTTNPDNGKSAKLPYFDKELLTSTTFNDSNLALAEVKENVSFPFRQSVENNVTYYEFDSAKDVVRFNKEGELEYKGTSASEQVKDVKGNPGFFPYNKASESKSDSLNFGFGTKIEIPFTVTPNGKINGQDIVFQFEGDDDVWVYVDDELAMDLGGGHGKVSGEINLATGKTKVSMVKNNSVAFSSRNKAVCSGITNDISSIVTLKTLTGSKTNLKKKLGKEIKTKLKDTSKVHTLTVYYMERGEWQSNMKMKFNLPEPNNITVVNELETGKINDTFKKVAQEVAEKDEFTYAITDKNLNEYDEQVLKDKEYVSYTDEFKYNDTMELKLAGLKDQTRKAEELYNTNYVLSDAKEDIVSEKSNVVSDKRAKTEGAFIFKNKSNTTTPFLMASFKNEVATATLEIVNSVGTKISDKDEFKYVVVYSEVFGGKSEAKYYEGKYTVEDKDGKTEQRETKDGSIVLKANEKAYIKGIPTATKVAVQQSEMKEAYYIEAINATENFKKDDKKAVAVGQIKKGSNEVVFAIDTDEDGESLDDSPKTADNAKVLFWVINIIAALGVLGVTTLVIYRKRIRK